MEKLLPTTSNNPHLPFHRKFTQPIKLQLFSIMKNDKFTNLYDALTCAILCKWENEYEEEHQLKETFFSQQHILFQFMGQMLMDVKAMFSNTYNRQANNLTFEMDIKQNWGVHY